MKKAIEKILKENNLKNTKGHFTVLKILIENNHPITVEEISKKINIKINLTTLYRILEKFSQAGIIYKTNFLDGKSYFEFQNDHHHHITCNKCGLQNKIDSCVLKEIDKINLEDTDFPKISSHVLEFFGLCYKCQKK